jgi:hypothetical protein
MRTALSTGVCKYVTMTLKQLRVQVRRKLFVRAKHKPTLEPRVLTEKQRSVIEQAMERAEVRQWS